MYEDDGRLCCSTLRLRNDKRDRRKYRYGKLVVGITYIADRRGTDYGERVPLYARVENLRTAPRRTIQRSVLPAHGDQHMLKTRLLFRRKGFKLVGRWSYRSRYEESGS